MAEIIDEERFRIFEWLRHRSARDASAKREVDAVRHIGHCDLSW
jgi:hypothetical protein